MNKFAYTHPQVPTTFKEMSKLANNPKLPKAFDRALGTYAQIGVDAVRAFELLSCDITAFPRMEAEVIHQTNLLNNGGRFDAITLLETMEKVLKAGLTDLGIDPTRDPRK